MVKKSSSRRELRLECDTMDVASSTLAAKVLDLDAWFACKPAVTVLEAISFTQNLKLVALELLHLSPASKICNTSLRYHGEPITRIIFLELKTSTNSSSATDG